VRTSKKKREGIGRRTENRTVLWTFRAVFDLSKEMLGKQQTTGEHEKGKGDNNKQGRKKNESETVTKCQNFKPKGGNAKPSMQKGVKPKKSYHVAKVGR